MFIGKCVQKEYMSNSKIKLRFLSIDSHKKRIHSITTFTQLYEVGHDVMFTVSRVINSYSQVQRRTKSIQSQ